MMRTIARTNIAATVRLYISLNLITDWASEVLPLSLAVDNKNIHKALPNTNAAIVLSKRRRLFVIQNPLTVLIDANHRLSYPLAKRLEVEDGECKYSKSCKDFGGHN